MSSDRIIPLEQLGVYREDWTIQGLFIVATNGVFDIIHIGHTRYLAEAARYSDLLVVGLNRDESTRRLKGNKRPINPAEHRAEVLLALESVDYVVIFNEDTGAEFIRELCPDVYIKGGDYDCSEVIASEEAGIVLAQGGGVHVAQGASEVSTSGIIERIRGMYNAEEG